MSAATERAKRIAEGHAARLEAEREAERTRYAAQVSRVADAIERAFEEQGCTLGRTF